MSYSRRLGKEHSISTNSKCRNQVTSTDNLCGINETECEVVCRFYKANFRETGFAKSRAIARYITEPPNPKEIHAPSFSTAWNFRVLGPDVGMIDTNNPSIPVWFGIRFSGRRPQHNVWMCTRIDCVALPL